LFDVFFHDVCARGGTVRETGSGLSAMKLEMKAMRRLRELLALCEPECFTRNPITTYEAMSTRD